MHNFEYCAYTYRHRRAMEYLINKMLPDGETKREMMRRAQAHDIDKMINYQFMSREDASNYHKKHSSHHMANNLSKTYYDKLEAVLDYESAGYTKPDKPLNAFDTIAKLREKGIVSDRICDDLLIICQGLQIAKSYSVTDDAEGMAYLSQYENVTEEMIVKDIQDYMFKRLEK